MNETPIHKDIKAIRGFPLTLAIPTPTTTMVKSYLSFLAEEHPNVLDALEPLAGSAFADEINWSQLFAEHVHLMDERLQSD